MKTLILGGARSGKSRLAEQRARHSELDVTCVATATAGDEEMRARIAAHQAQRPQHWRLVEEPLALASAMRSHATAQGLLLVDCLSLWMCNLLSHPDPDRWPAERADLLAALPALPGEVLIVSNETGLGVVPMGELSRRYCDESGWLHQELARRCDRVIFIVAGLPQLLKGKPWTSPS
jgi:adenosylcobinamide kinase/adenosylcobinamide-phosphate guanylyltransferase